MKVVVMFDSKYGNTESIARSICSGMKEVGISQVECKMGNQVTPDELRTADVWVLGSPTHMGGVSRNFKKLFKWMRKEELHGKRGAVFETRLGNMSGGAAQKIGEEMLRAGIQLVSDPESFIVEGRKGPLADGEEARAVVFGRRIAGTLRS